MMSSRAWVLSRASSSVGESRRVKGADWGADWAEPGARAPRSKKRRAGSPSRRANRGRRSSAASFPVEAYRQVQGFVPLLPEGAAGSRPRLRAAAMARATQVFPKPGSPDRMERAPAARRSFQSQSMGRGSMSARQTRSAWRAAGGVSSLKEGCGGCRMSAEDGDAGSRGSSPGWSTGSG